MKKEVSHPRWAEGRRNRAGVRAEEHPKVTVALLTMAKTWKLKCSLTDDCIKRQVLPTME